MYLICSLSTAFFLIVFTYAQKYDRFAKILLVFFTDNTMGGLPSIKKENISSSIIKIGQCISLKEEKLYLLVYPVDV